MCWQRLHVAVVTLRRVARRFEPFFRPPLEIALREPGGAPMLGLIKRRRREKPEPRGFADNVSFSPRRRMYCGFSGDRQHENRKPHIEPKGDEVFDGQLKVAA